MERLRVSAVELHIPGSAEQPAKESRGTPTIQRQQKSLACIYRAYQESVLVCAV